ncbi:MULTISPECIES: hypothetical protein [unclassified Knoellia]|uniref:hypothetical protein n=1 Tax=Knoellia altitudinis TaxID=3404795 RepID=UPI00360B8659
MSTSIRRRLIAGLAALVTGSGLVIGVVAAAPAHASDDFPEVSSCEDEDLASFRGTWQKKRWDVFAGGVISRDYVPQGLAYDAAHDVFFVSYYDGRPAIDDDYEARNALIAAFDSRGGYRTHVQVDPVNANPAGGAHVGGLAVVDGWLVVAETADLLGDGDTEADPHVFSYKVDQVLRRAPGRVMPIRNNTLTRAGSYATSHRGKLYVGSFEGNRLYEYDALNGDGIPYGQWRTFVTPSKTQGAAVAGRFFAFSRSEGRTLASLLTVTEKQQSTDTSALTVHYEQKIRTMSEGITWAPRNDGTPSLFALFESAATVYAGDGGTCSSPNLWSIRRELIRPPRG